MIEQEANPFVVNYGGYDQFTFWNLSKSCLSDLPKIKSVYFTIRPHVSEFKDRDDFLNPWFYRTGVFGSFGSVIGHGASATVISGDWFGKRAAFKFVEIGTQIRQERIEDNLKVLNDKLSEMTSIQSTEGSKIVKFYGHYR